MLCVGGVEVEGVVEEEKGGRSERMGEEEGEELVDGIEGLASGEDSVAYLLLPMPSIPSLPSNPSIFLEPVVTDRAAGVDVLVDFYYHQSLSNRSPNPNQQSDKSMNTYRSPPHKPPPRDPH